MIKDLRIDPEISEDTKQFFNRIIWTLIVLNVLLGGITVYDRYIYDHTPIVYREITTIYHNEI